MTENITTENYSYPEKFIKRNIYGGVVTTSWIMQMYNLPNRTAYNWLDKCKSRLQKEIITVKDWSIHMGFSSPQEMAEEISRNLKY